MKQTKLSNKKKKGVLFPLVVKLITIISLIVVLSTGLITGLTSWFFSADLKARTEDHNLALVQVFTSEVGSEIRTVYESTLSFLDTLKFNESSTFLERLEENFSDRHPKIAYIEVSGEKTVYNKNFFAERNVSEDIVPQFLAAKKGLLAQANEGSSLLINATPWFSFPMIAFVGPYKAYGKKDRLIILFSSENLQSRVELDSAFITFLVSQHEELLVYPDFDLLQANSISADNSLVSTIFESTQEGMQIKESINGEEYLIAFQKIPLIQSAVVSQVPLALVYEPIRRMVYRNLLLIGIVLLLSILSVWFFAHSISRPVLALTDEVAKIENSNFTIKIKPTTRDEIGLLTKTFVKMGKGLAEKERLRETFGKFVNKEIVERAAKGELQLGGENKTATIFFSDIRAFTEISESMSPEKVVEFLNEYMTYMVDCIDKTQGVVDKFIGDAIMAVWGAPFSTGSIRKDAYQAINAMLLMRKKLIEFNKDRGGEGKPILKIGCGLNTGPCIAGQIGSTKRMEYTVIGDTVNTASRIESLNKPFGTDILISETTYELVKDDLIVETMPPITVKGKKESLQIYAVVNFKNEEGPQTLEEVRSLLGIVVPETPMNNLNEKEKKYEILSKKD